MFATGMTCSHEQLIMDEAICAFSRRITEGLTVSEDTVARDLIKSIGPDGGTYLTTDHTLKWLRSKEYVDRRISVSGPYASWKQAGERDSSQVARDLVRKYRELEAPPFDEKRRAGIREIVSQFRP
jgi:trimethylamine--corrinoid protein Co-methyltransferase